MSKKIKILMSLSSLGMGGNIIFAMNFFRHIDADKFQIDFLIQNDTKMDFYNEIINRGSKVFVLRGKKFAERKKELKEIIEKEHYGIIHVNSCSFRGLFRIVLPVSSLKSGVKIIAHSHNPGLPKNNAADRMMRKLLKSFLTSKIECGFACSEESGESKFTSEFMKSDKFYVINNAIETKKFEYREDIRNELRKEYGIEDKFVIGSVGRLEQQKNYLFFIDVLKELVKTRPDTIFLLAGRGSQMDALKQKAVDYNLENNVIFTGKISDPERFYMAMDLFVLPSVYEGFGFVNIEAQVSGLTCVVSDRVPKDVDISGCVSFVELDVRKWVDAIRNTNVNAAERKTCFTEKYDLPCETKRLEGIYESLLK